MEVTALDLIKALASVMETDPDPILGSLREGVRLNSIDDSEGGDDEAVVRISFGGRDLFDLKIERVP